MKRSFIRHALVFAVTLGVCAALLLASVALIPQSALQESSEQALSYFTENPGFPLLWESHVGTRMDNYADCALLDVIYNADASRPLYSMIAAPYYRIEGNSIHLDFAASVLDGQAPNNEYSRYWHGSQIFLRPLLALTTLQGSRIALFALLAALNIALSIVMIRKKQLKPLLIYLAALLIVQAWVAAFTLEYIMTFLVMTAVCIAVVQMDEKHLSAVFLAGGVLTCFLDFLTTETLVFTVPALLWLMMRKPVRFREGFLTLVKWGIAWLIGYALTFAVKWALVYIVLGGDAFLSALTSAAYRVERPLEVVGGAEGQTVSTLASLPLVISRNLACLVPFSESLTVSQLGWIFAGIIAAVFALVYLFRGAKVDGGFIGLCVLIALIPLLRFIVMSSHSADHYFFTYRALMASVMALIAVPAYTLEPSYILHSSKKKGRK